MSIFKSYDIRGRWGTDWDAARAHAIGRHLPGLLGARSIVVGRDARLSSGEIFAALSRGITESGCGVVDIGMCDTPAVYFATAFYGADGGVMITASHNPPEDNGLKISGRGSVPVGYDTGLARLESARRRTAPRPRGPRGGCRHAGHPRGLRGPPRAVPLGSLLPQRGHRLLERHGGRVPARRAGRNGRTVHVPVRAARRHFPQSPAQPAGRGEPRGPQGVGSPAEKADLGICFDGDADRVMFVDERGRFVSPDLVIGLIGTWYFRLHPRRGRRRLPGGHLRRALLARRRGVPAGAGRRAGDVQGRPFAREEAPARERGHLRRRAGGALLLPRKLLLRFGHDRGADRPGDHRDGRAAPLGARRGGRQVLPLGGDQLHGSTAAAGSSGRSSGTTPRAR